VVLVIGGSYAASRTEALDLRWSSGVGIRTTEGEQGTGARLVRCDGGAGTPRVLDIVAQWPTPTRSDC